jgi:hypothetical protein
MHFSLRTIAAPLIAGSLGLCLMGAANDQASPADAAFTTNVMKLTLQNAANAQAVESGQAPDGIHSLATAISSDSIDMGTRLASLADYYGISVSTDLPKATGAPEAFAKDQVASLTQLIDLCKSEQANGGGAQLRTLAADLLPTLQKDLEAAKAAK